MTAKAENLDEYEDFDMAEDAIIYADDYSCDGYEGEGGCAGDPEKIGEVEQMGTVKQQLNQLTLQQIFSQAL